MGIRFHFRGEFIGQSKAALSALGIVLAVSALRHQFVDDRRGAPDLIVGGGIAVGAVLLAHHLDRQAAACRDLLGANVAGERRGLLHAEVEQDGRGGR